MVNKDDFRELDFDRAEQCFTASNVSVGVPIPKTKRVELFSPADWEGFIEEWATSLENTYRSVARFPGAGDMGLDVVGYITETTFAGGWDSYQCKHYDHPLRPTDAYVEIAKIIYYSFAGEFPVPRRHYFAASKGIGTTLAQLLSDPVRLKAETKKNWKQYCESSISSKLTMPLKGKFNKYFDAFDFSIFSSKSVAEVILGHSQTPFHSVRFGGGLPARPVVQGPPNEIAPTESRYIQQLYEA